MGVGVNACQGSVVDACASGHVADLGCQENGLGDCSGAS